jgi:hypothetical protein
MLSVVMLNVIMLNVIMLSAMAHCEHILFFSNSRTNVNKQSALHPEGVSPQIVCG